MKNEKKSKAWILYADAGVSFGIARSGKGHQSRENVRKSYVNKAAVSPKTGEGMEIPGAAVVAGASALLALVADRKRKEEQT